MDTKKLRQKILDLAIHGKLVPQDPNDEPASVLLERIRKEKEQLIKEGKIKAPKKGKSAGDTSHYPKEGPWELPEGWCWRYLNSIGRWQSGATPSRGVKDYYGGTTPWLKTGDLNDDYIKDIPERITDKALKETSVKLNPEGSVLIAMYGATIGKVGILTYPATTNQACCACSELCGVDNRYLFYFLISHKDEFIRQAGGGAQPNISKEIIVNTPMPVPPIEEQKRIVYEIEKWFRIIKGIDDSELSIRAVTDTCKAKILDLAIHGKLVPQDQNDESAIELLRRINPNFKPSDNLHYGECLPNGWICVTYGEVNQHVNKSINPMDSPKECFELYSVPIYDTGNPEFLTGEEIGSTKQAVKKGDVLLCKINPHLNRSWVVEDQRPELQCIASSEWLIFQSDAICPEYARLFFMSPAFRTLMLSNVSGVGGSLMRARASAVDGYPLWIPPKKEQKRIVDVVKAYYNVLDEIVAGLN